MEESLKPSKAGAPANKLLRELKKLTEASETGDFNIALEGGRLSGEEAEAVRLLNEAIGNYRDSLEYDLMKYKLTSDALSIALWDMDVVSGDPVNPNNQFTWSPEFRHMLGFSDEKDFPNILQSWSSRLHPEDRERALDAFAAHMNDHSGGTPYNIEYRLRLKNGHYRNFHAFGTTLRDDAGLPLRVAGAVMDITEKKQMTEALQHRDNLLSTANRAAQILLGVEREENIAAALKDSMELVGRSIDVDRVHIWRNELIDGEPYFVHTYQWLSDVGEQKSPVPAGLKLAYEDLPDWKKKGPLGGHICGPLSEMPPDDQKFFGAYDIKTLVTIPLFLQDHFWGVFTLDDCRHERTFTEDEIDILRSISLMMASAVDRNAQADQIRRALEETQRANSAKSTFLANMSHEMRTPLNAVLGLTELTLNTMNSRCYQEHREHLERIYNAGATLLSIINDILDISKIEAGKLELIEVDYDVPSFINDTVTQNVMRIGEKPIEFILKIGDDMFSRLYGDELRVKQIANNLLSNAIKYTKKGTVELKISCDPEDDGLAWLTIQVRDTGLGIRQDDMEKLFIDYVQVDLEANRNIEGTGLGLPLAKRLAEMMDGSITVESEYGQGSVFTARLRQKIASDIRMDPEIVNSLRSFQFSDGRLNLNMRFTRVRLPYARVLIVDDNQTNLDVARGLMRPYGMYIDCVDNGWKAVDVIRAEDVIYNAVFMDHMMPGLDGIETTRLIREIGTDYAKNLPIIALTANAIVGSEEMFLSQGFQAFLSKPIDIFRLDALIKHWVRDENLEKTFADGQYLEDGRGISEASEGPAPELLKKQLNGLDLKKGLERFGSDEGLFLDVLRSFAANTRPLLESMKNVSKDSLDDYAVTVHGIKGSSRGIFADLIGAAAEELEKAARDGDFGYVAAHNSTFLESAWKLIHDLDGLLAAVDAETQKPIKDRPEAAALSKLRAACEGYDMDGVDAAMEEIESSRYESDNGLAAWLRENVDMMNFQQIVEKISSIS